MILTSGGLGPTADDLTAEVVADFAGREMALDAALEERIWAISTRLRARWRDGDEEPMRAGSRKQALVPDGATVLEPVGHRARASSCRRDGADVRRAARAARRAAADVATRRSRPRRCGRAGRRRRARAADPAALRAAGVRDRRDAARRSSATACRSTGWRSRPACGAARSRSRPSSRRRPPATTPRFEAAVRERHGDALFSDDGATIDELVARLLGRAARSRSPSRAPAG